MDNELLERLERIALMRIEKIELANSLEEKISKVSDKNEKVNLKKQVKELDEDIEDIESRCKKIKKIINTYNGSDNENVKSEALSKIKSLVSEIEKDYFSCVLVNKKEENHENKVHSVKRHELKQPEIEEVERLKLEEPNQTKVSKKTVLSILAALAAAGILVGVVKGCSNKNAKTSETQAAVEETIDNLTFTNINDEEQVTTRATEIKAMLDSVCTHDLTVEELENILKWINGGVVDEAGQEEALFAISRVEMLMNKENQKETSDSIKFSEFYLDGTQGEKLATKIDDIREDIYDATTNEGKIIDETAYQTAANNYLELITNSWLLNGYNNEVSAYALETSGMEALTDKLFLNTNALVNADPEMTYSIIDGTQYYLDDIDRLCNEANCPTVVTADNGETFSAYMNKFTSDMIGMVTEAKLNKQDSNTKTLTK